MSPSHQRRRLQSVATAAEYIGVHPKTLRRWIATGRLTAYRAGPKLLRIDLEELDQMMRPVGRPKKQPAGTGR